MYKNIEKQTMLNLKNPAGSRTHLLETKRFIFQTSAIPVTHG